MCFRNVIERYSMNIRTESLHYNEKRNTSKKFLDICSIQVFLKCWRNKLPSVELKCQSGQPHGRVVRGGRSHRGSASSPRDRRDTRRVLASTPYARYSYALTALFMLFICRVTVRPLIIVTKEIVIKNVSTTIFRPS